MRGALLLLVLAALLSLASSRIELAKSVAARPVAETPTPARAPTREPLLTGLTTREAMSVPASFTPLFRAAEAPEESATPQPGERFRLVGLAGQGSSRMAFLRDEADGRAFSGRAGESIAGWILHEVANRCVDLRRERHRQEACM